MIGNVRMIRLGWAERGWVDMVGGLRGVYSRGWIGIAS